MKVLTDNEQKEISGGIAILGSQERLAPRFTGRLQLRDQWVTVQAASQVVIAEKSSNG